MANRILIDTNVLLDYLFIREPFYDDAKNIIFACADGKVKGCIAAHSEEFADFEDCLHMECAKAFDADYIVTRNVADYKESEIKAILPKDYLGL